MHDGKKGERVLPAQWLSNSSDISGRVTNSLQGVLHSLAQPARARRLRQVLFVLFALWAVLALSRLVWSLLPAGETSVAADVPVINPVASRGASARGDSLDIDRMVAWHLFGEAGSAAEVVVEEDVAEIATPRDGIEKGARETRLDLKLRGIVASTEDGLGHAIIEHKSQQSVYAVEDKLPVAGQVVLVKVMPRQVVLDNGGTYELLLLFDDSQLDAQLSSRPVQATTPGSTPRPSAAAGQIDKRTDTDATALAQSYREQLYQNPQSLAEVVSVSAVREDGNLLGYRIGPGKDPAQFAQLGFKPGDLVTGINGITLDDPANTMRLYQVMRSASEAVFELERENRQLTVSVRLDDGVAQ
jgi:general secretion pathway protein C